MRKILFPGSLVLIAALLLSACGGGTAQVTPQAPVTGVTDSVPTTSAPTMAEPTESATMAEPTAEATEAVTAEATGEATVEATAEATAEGDATPEIVAPPEPGTAFVRLTSLLQSTVNAGDGSAGSVDGVLVEHPEPPVVVEEVEAGAATPTPAPTVENAVTAFTVRYVLVDTRGSEAAGTGSGPGKIVLVPWQAVDFTGISDAGAAADSAIGVRPGMNVVANAPHVSLSELATLSSSLTDEVNMYWSGQNLPGFPTSAVTENLALVPGDFRAITISDNAGNALGSLSDFIIDQATGEIVHVVFEGGEALGNRQLVVPLNHLTWSGNTGMQLGGFQFNFPTDLLQDVPEIDLNNLQMNPEWLNLLNQFWGSVQGQ